MKHDWFASRHLMYRRVKVLADTCPFWRLLVLLFWISGDISSGFSKPEWILPYLLFCGSRCNVHSLRSTSGATHASLLAASSAASHFPTCISRGRTWLGFERAITWTEDERTTIVCLRPGFKRTLCFTLFGAKGA